MFKKTVTSVVATAVITILSGAAFAGPAARASGCTATRRMASCSWRTPNAKACTDRPTTTAGVGSSMPCSKVKSKWAPTPGCRSRTAAFAW